MNLRILLVDDNAQIRELLTLLLGREQAHVTAVNDGQQAIERLRHARQPFDLVLSDVEMPNADGWGVLAWVQEHAATLPVVLMSGGLPDSFIQTAWEGGACGAMPKPFRKEWLHDLLLCLFDLAGQHRQREFYCPRPTPHPGRGTTICAANTSSRT